MCLLVFLAISPVVDQTYARVPNVQTIWFGFYYYCYIFCGFFFSFHGCSFEKQQQQQQSYIQRQKAAIYFCKHTLEMKKHGSMIMYAFIVEVYIKK